MIETSPRFRVAALLSAGACGWFATSCENESSKTAPAPSSSASAPALTVSKPAKSWFEGDWSGSFDAKVFTIAAEKNEGPLPAWEKPDARAFVGPGNLRLGVDQTGLARGTGDGPFGNLVLSGQVEGETLRLRFASDSNEPAKRFAGFMIAERKADRLVGTLQASAGDSGQVRTAEVQFTKPKAK